IGRPVCPAGGGPSPRAIRAIQRPGPRAIRLCAGHGSPEPRSVDGRRVRRRHGGRTDRWSGASVTLRLTPGTGGVAFSLARMNPRGGFLMLRWAIVFAIIALIAGALGFYGLESVSADIAKFFALVFLILFVVALVVGRSVVGGPTV